MRKELERPENYTDQLASLVGFISRACAFTGHRPKKLPWRNDETAPECAALKATLTEQIAALIEKGYTHFMSGMAEGTDVWAAQSVLAFREENPALKLHCILPCFNQSEEWSASSQARYRSILEHADSVIFINREDKKDCMLERNRFLVSYAATVLAVYNGERRGGTAATVRYARRLGREVIVIDPLTRSVTHDKTAP